MNTYGVVMKATYNSQSQVIKSQYMNLKKSNEIIM
jgi:hypothetical protein